jgi:3-dehydroquinate dehydratase/shikimate dehydrogenase
MKEKQQGIICVPVCVERARDLAASVARAARVGDLVELRLDCLRGAELEEALRGLHALLRTQSCPFILTLRPAEQGGHLEIDSLSRVAFWLEYFGYDEQFTGFADIELDVAVLLAEQRAPLDWSRVICSHHDFAGSSDLESIYARMKPTPARILKLAVRVKEMTDCLALLRLFERARLEGREMVAIAMGEAGTWTRILAPSRGAFLTYGALDAESATAPGQPTAAELRDLYRVHKLDEHTEIMGLVGDPVAHSVSPHMHNAAFDASGLNAVYIPFEVRDAKAFLHRMAHPRTREISWNLRGLSVTAPHKSAVLEHLDWIEQSAREIGAANTIVIQSNELHGYNTDAKALLAPLLDRIGHLRDKRFAIIGAGGAARAALWSLRREGAHTTLFARNPERARHLAKEFDASFHPLDASSFDGFDVVINATPLGTRGLHQDDTPARATQLRGAGIIYDLVYNPLETRLMREARAAGCDTIGGLAMLIAQAAEQFKIWTGKPAPVEVMRDAALHALKE